MKLGSKVNTDEILRELKKPLQLVFAPFKTKLRTEFSFSLLLSLLACP